MKSLTIFSSLLSLASAGALLGARDACHADNCLRAVGGTAAGTAVLATHISQCSSFLSVTIRPSSTVITRTITTYLVLGNDFNTDPPLTPGESPTSGTPITISGTSVPSYATAGCNPNSGNTTPLWDRFASACKCAGVTPLTSYQPTPTATYTITQTSTVASFQVTATGPAGGWLDKDALNADIIRAGFTAGTKGHLWCKLDGGYLEIIGNGLDGYQAYQVPDATSYPLYFQTPPHIPPGHRVAFVVHNDLSITGTTSNGNTIFQNCGGLLDMSNAPGGVDFFGSTCTPVALVAVPLP